MITESNFRDLLLSLNFTQNNESYEKDFFYFGMECKMRADFSEHKLYYPDVIKGRERNDGFNAPENFVVFECVNRLLDKGYRPEHIELEKEWHLGHDPKSGRADICVSDENGSMLFIIECKTWGKEFDKALNDTKNDGAQLFSYWQQDPAAKWLVLYASDFKNGCVQYKAPTINCSDDPNVVLLAKKDKSIKLYLDAKPASEKYEVWKETYLCQIHNDLIFSDDSVAYQIGVKPLRKKDLLDFTPDDKIVNKFEEILRHNNVSDKENAFNRLIALFICKLVDESTKDENDEVEFQYKSGTDTYETLQDRLQRLHCDGMEKFMREKILYVSSDYPEWLFSNYTGSKRKNAINDLKEKIKILKFYSNNDFAFKDVHNEELFYQNGKILVEMVQLFEKYRIVYPSKHQFLGDLFEQLLNKGFKQNEGQFFTPMPITRFIWDSLPVDNMIRSERGTVYPKVIDYACGAGHFLTEAVEAINYFAHSDDNSWTRDHIYGIEKDYRLARVAKISLFMNGAGEGNIIFGDGLENAPDKGIGNGTFDILVANPPYAVKDFKQHLQLKDNNFEILDKITLSGSEIETLFVERIGQLLKPQGIAAVILPSSILSNNDASYIGAREQFLQNFYIRAIVSLGAKTFGATGTNTVIMFLEKFNEPPKQCELISDSIDAIFSCDDLDSWQDKDILDAYISHIEVDEDTYKAFLSKELSISEIENDDYLKMYISAFADSSEVKALAKNSAYKKSNATEKEIKYREAFYSYAYNIEKEKLKYFSFVYRQTTVIINSPIDNKEQKEFLGYEWSNRKGNEGIQIITPGGKLYDDSNRSSEGTLANAIKKSYTGIIPSLSEEQSAYANVVNTKDMLDFSRASFNKAIRVNVKSQNRPVSKYLLKALSELIVDVSGYNTKVSMKDVYESGSIPVVTQEKDKLISGYTDTDQFISDVPIILFGDHTCVFKYIDFNFVRGADGTQLLKVNSDEIETKYLYYYLSSIEIENSNRYERHMKYLKKVLVPIPPMEVQRQIITECEKIDEEYNSTRMSIEAYRNKIEELFDELDIMQTGGKTIALENICSYVNNRVNYSSIEPETYISTDNMLQNCRGVMKYEGIPNVETVIEYKYGDVLLSNIRPYLQKIWFAENNGGCSPDVLVLRVFNNDFSSRYIYYSMKRQKFFDYVMENVHGTKMPRGDKGHILKYKLPDISPVEQADVVSKINAIESKIAESEEYLTSLDGKISEILNKYLN